MEAVVTIGLDIAKSVFQVHGVDGSGAVVVRRQLTRAKVLAFFEKLPACLVGLEACATALLGSRTPQAWPRCAPSYVKPYVKGQKNDAADAGAICVAWTKSLEQVPKPPFSRCHHSGLIPSGGYGLATLVQLVRAARLPGSGTSEVGVNAALALIEGAQPRGEVEAALVIQMACTHAAAMSVFARFGGDYGSDRTMTAGANAVAKLTRAYATQVEALRRLRNGGSQLVRVEHVHVHEGGQAIVGAVAVGPRDAKATSE